MMFNESDISNKTLVHQILTQLQAVQDLMTESQKQKLIPGRHIRISETEHGVLIEADTQELPDALKRWIMETDQKLQRPPAINAENGINAEWDGSSWHLSLSAADLPQIARISNSVPEQESGTVFLPFQVSCSGYVSSTTLHDAGWVIKVHGWNPDEGQYFRNLVFVGIQSPLEIPESTLIIPSEGWIYVQICYNSSNEAYTAELKYASSFPETGPGTYQVPLAQILITDQGEVHIGQQHTGNIFAAGRIL